MIGGGVAGLAAAWSVCARGVRDVTLVEREDVLGAGATGQNAAILRTAIADPVTAELALFGGRSLREPATELARDAAGHLRELVDARGLVVLRPKPAAWTSRAHALGAAELKARVPFLAADAGPAFLLENEGVVDVPALVAAHAHALVAAGARLVLGARVRCLRTRLDERTAAARVDGVELEDGSTLEADVVVLAAGAWSGALGQAAGSRVRITATRRHLIVTAHDARVDPRAPVVWSDADGVYARPEAGGYLACPCDEDAIDPECFDASPAAIEAVRAKLARVMPGLPAAPIARLWAGSRAGVRDARFVVGRDPDVAGLVWATALGGHGITCAAAVGELAADAVSGERGAHGIPADVVAACSPARDAARG